MEKSDCYICIQLTGDVTNEQQTKLQERRETIKDLGAVEDEAGRGN